MKSRPAPSASATRFRRKPLITALEPRLLLDGAAVATTVDMATDVDYQDQTADQTVHSASAEDSVHFTEAAAPASTDPARREVAFVDTQVQDYQALVNGMAEGVEVFLIDAGRNGLEQMLAHLQGQKGIDAIHVYSHGDIGQLTLGSLTLNGDNLVQHSSLLTQLGETLGENGDLMLYGCYVGADSEGQAFIDEIARLSGADVAASDDLTGSSALGGDWTLEAAAGPIETTIVSVSDFNGLLATPSISSLSNFTYAEDSGAVTIDGDITISGSSDFRGGYIQFSVTGATSFETLGINTSASASTASGVISVVGSTVYRGTGSAAEVIGSVDSTLNGQNGQALRFNLSNAFQNGSFDIGNEGDTVITGWSVQNGRIRLDGNYQIAGQATPLDTTYGAGNTTGDYSTNGSFTQTTNLSSYAAEGGAGDLALELNTGASSIDQPYGVIRGPAVYSNGTVSLQQGDQVSFKWKALSGGDAFDAYGYIINVNTGQTVTILNETGSNTNEETPWYDRSITIGAGQEGVYRFVFVAGSYDLSGGQYLGGKLMIDDVTVTQANPPSALSSSDVSSLSRLVTYRNTDQDFATTSRTLTVTAKDGSGDPAGSASATITLARVNDSPSLSGGATLAAVDEDTSNPSGTTISSLLNARFSDPDALNSPADTLAGIAIVGNASSSTEGAWEYSTDSGSNWYSVDTVSTSNALLLSSSTLIRFRPSADWNGTPGSLSVHAVDSSHAGGFTNGSGRVTFNTTTDDATSAVSASAVNLSTSITAVNDAPVLTNGADTDSLTETGTTLTASGSMTVTDVDLTDTVAITVDSVSTGGTFSGINPLTNAQLKAMLAVSATSPANIAALAADPSAGSTFDWTFTSGAAGDAAFNFLREGETLILTYTLKATDSSGASSTASSTSTVTITITGTNENVTVSATPSGGYLEAVDASAQTISESGTVSFADVDLTDRINITFASNNDIVWKKASGAIPGTLNAALINQLIAGFQVGAVDAPVPGSVPWTYNIADADLDFLNIGDTITFSYTVTATDSSGATATDVVRFTFTGTNDVPVADMVVIDQTWPFGKPYELDIAQRFSDRDARASGEDLDFTLTGLPGGLSYNAETGLISGIPTGIGKFTITMTATDRQGTSVTRQFVLEVLAPPQPPVMTPVADAPPPPSAPALDTTQVTNDTTPLPSGTVSTGFSTDPVQEAGFMAPTRQIVEPSQAGNGSTAAGSAGPGNVSAPDDGASAGNSGTERILVAEGNTRVSEVVSPDGRVTSVRASIQVEVATNGQVVFNDVQKQAFGIVGLSVSSISSGDNGLSVSIADAARGQDTQFYTGELGNGESLPDWITVDQNTGEITIGNPPPGIDAVTVRVKAIGSDGKVRMLDIELKLSDLLKRKSLQDLQPGSTETLEPVGFVPLTDQVAAEVASSDGYGERLIALLEAA